MKVLLMAASIILFGQNNDNQRGWRIVDDVVMGGESQGKVDFNGKGNLVFKGNVSLENNGGFSSVRKRLKTIKLDGQTRVKIKLRGDGKAYQFRVKSESYQAHAYVYNFETSGNWQDLEWSLDEMYPQFRGRKLRMSNFKESQIEEIGFLIGNKKNEEFKIEIASIEIY